MDLCEMIMIRKLIFFVLLGSIIYFSLVPEYFGNDISLPKIAIVQSGFFEHVFGYFVLGYVLFCTFNKKMIWYYLAGLSVLGVILEVLQIIIPLRAFNVYDILGNCIGLSIVGFIVYIKTKNLGSSASNGYRFHSCLHSTKHTQYKSK